MLSWAAAVCGVPSRGGGDENRGCVPRLACGLTLSFQLAAVCGTDSSTPARALPCVRETHSMRIIEAHRPHVCSQPVPKCWQFY